MIGRLLQPRTDVGVLIQLVALASLLAAAVFATRRHPDARLLVIGVGIVVVALAGLRAAH